MTPGASDDQRPRQLRHVLEVAAAHHVEVVPLGRIVRLVRGLDAALRHHRVGVADAQLGDDEHLRARARPRPARRTRPPRPRR